MKLAVLGSGMIVRDFLPHAAAVDGLDLVAICGRPASADRLAAMRDEFGIDRVHLDLDACLADPDIDTVWIAVPNSLHAEYARKALEAGKHVVCEKPFVLDERDLQERNCRDCQLREAEQQSNQPGRAATVPAARDDLR